MEKILDTMDIKSLVELRNSISDRISNYKDGYFYICKVRSYGRTWNDNSIFNIHTLQELCYEYYGEDGIIDVYSNNPDLSTLDNYGNVMYVPTIDDYNKWYEYTMLNNLVSDITKNLDEWDNRDNMPYMYRPHFTPIYSREDLNEFKDKISSYDMSFVSPTHVVRVYNE